MMVTTRTPYLSVDDTDLTGRRVWLVDERTKVSACALVIKDYGEGTLYVRWQESGKEQHLGLGTDYTIDQTYTPKSARAQETV